MYMLSLSLHVLFQQYYSICLSCSIIFFLFFFFFQAEDGIRDSSVTGVQTCALPICPFVQELERRVSDLIGVKHCIAICNGTVALEIAIRALEMAGEVIVPSFTFIATAHALQWQGITPVFCDIDPRTCTLDPKKVEQAITPRTTGIIGVHGWGHICDIDALNEIAAPRNLTWLFDSAHAFAA